MVDYYKVLGVSSDTTSAEIKEAYRKLALKYHPDVSSASSPEAKALNKERFALVNQAYENLKTIDGRRAYRFATQADSNWQRAKRGYSESSAEKGSAYHDVQMDFDEAERRWRHANHKTHERSMKFMRSFERAIHPKMLFFIIPCGVLIYYGLSTGVKFAYTSISELYKTAIDENALVSSSKSHIKMNRTKAIGIGKAAIEAAEGAQRRGTLYGRSMDKPSQW